MKYLVNCSWLNGKTWQNVSKGFDDYESAKAFADYCYNGIQNTEVTVLIYELKESMN